MLLLGAVAVALLLRRLTRRREAVTVTGGDTPEPAVDQDYARRLEDLARDGDS